MTIDTQKLSLQALAGHGHVKPRPDGAVMRCGGPAICKVCQQEKAQMEMGQRLKAAFHPLDGQHINQGSADADAEAYEREFLQTKIDAQTAEVARLRGLLAGVLVPDLVPLLPAEYIAAVRAALSGEGK